MPDTTTDILGSALEWFSDESRWVQERPSQYDARGELSAACLTHAISRHVGEETARITARRLLVEACDEVDPCCTRFVSAGRPWRIVIWNDTPGRTFAEVRQALEKALAKAEELGV